MSQLRYERGTYCLLLQADQEVTDEEKVVEQIARSRGWTYQPIQDIDEFDDFFRSHQHQNALVVCWYLGPARIEPSTTFRQESLASCKGSQINLTKWQLSSWTANIDVVWFVDKKEAGIPVMDCLMAHASYTDRNRFVTIWAAETNPPASFVKSVVKVLDDNLKIQDRSYQNANDDESDKLTTRVFDNGARQHHDRAGEFVVKLTTSHVHLAQYRGVLVPGATFSGYPLPSRTPYQLGHWYDEVRYQSPKNIQLPLRAKFKLVERPRAPPRNDAGQVGPPQNTGATLNQDVVEGQGTDKGIEDDGREDNSCGPRTGGTKRTLDTSAGDIKAPRRRHIIPDSQEIEDSQDIPESQKLNGDEVDTVAVDKRQTGPGPRRVSSSGMQPTEGIADSQEVLDDQDVAESQGLHQRRIKKKRRAEHSPGTPGSRQVNAKKQRGSSS